MTNRPSTSTMRQHLDGELSPQQAADLQAFLREHPHERAAFEAQVEAERTVRARLISVMGAAQAPADLRERVLQSLQGANVAGDVVARIDGERVQMAGRPAASRRASHRADRINIFAVAATLALITGAVLFGIFGRTIDDVPVAPPVDLVSELANYAGNEHDVCAASNECLSKRAQYKAQAQAESLLTNWLSAPVHVTDLQSLGYDFLGAGPCELPVDVHSGHMVYRKQNPEGGPSPMVSLFVFPMKRQCGTKICDGPPCGTWDVVADEGSRCRHKVMRSSDGRLVYLLVCCNGRDLEPVANEIATTLKMNDAAPRAR